MCLYNLFPNTYLCKISSELVTGFILISEESLVTCREYNRSRGSGKYFVLFTLVSTWFFDIYSFYYSFLISWWSDAPFKAKDRFYNLSTKSLSMNVIVGGFLPRLVVIFVNIN